MKSHSEMACRHEIRFGVPFHCKKVAIATVHLRVFMLVSVVCDGATSSICHSGEAVHFELSRRKRTAAMQIQYEYRIFSKPEALVICLRFKK